ncbi:hypothetical protein, partial [Geomonas sp.]|uniref:hypothetical protein n=1 Tax=Geomonas sp. TaxID=2651584 RepID=UPI002B499BBA
VALAQEPGLYGTIVSVQDGYVYYVLGQDNNSGGTTAELRRVRIDGSAASESYFKVPTQYALECFDGIGTVYLSQGVYNDVYKYVRYDIATGKAVDLSTGNFFIFGFNSSSVYFADGRGYVYQEPVTGGQSTYVMSVPYPLELKPGWIPSGDGFYFIVSYMDPIKGYLSEVDYLEKVK